MIARIQISIMFDNGIITTGFGHGTDARLHPAPAGKSSIKLIYEDFSHIIADPVVENIA